MPEQIVLDMMIVLPHRAGLRAVVDAESPFTLCYFERVADLAAGSGRSSAWTRTAFAIFAGPGSCTTWSLAWPNIVLESPAS